MTFRIFSRLRKHSYKEMKAEAVTMQHILNHACTFKAFCNYHDVFDMEKRTRITKRNNLFKLHTLGIGLDSPVLIINKN